MPIILGVFAAVIMLMYAVYFVKIIKGNPSDFELEMLDALEHWIWDSKKGAGFSLGMLLLLSIILEAVFFTLVVLVIHNPVVLVFTALMVAMESWHLGQVFRSIQKFKAGKIKAQDIFNWRLERISATGFFTYSLIVLVSLLFF